MTKEAARLAERDVQIDIELAVGWQLVGMKQRFLHQVRVGNDGRIMNSSRVEIPVLTDQSRLPKTAKFV